MMLPPRLETLVERLQRQSDAKRKYELLLALAQRLPPMDPALKTPEHRVTGCVSQVFVAAQLVNGRVQFQGDSDAQMVKGLLALLIEGLNDLPAGAIAQLQPDFIQRTGLNVSLTPSRANGFYNIFRTLQRLALTLLESDVITPSA